MHSHLICDLQIRRVVGSYSFRPDGKDPLVPAGDSEKIS